MKILVTGVAGFIGMHVAKRLLERGDEVVGVDNLNDYYDVKLKQDRLEQLKPFGKFRFIKLDIAERETIADLFVQEKFERVINLAAQPGVRYSLKNPHATSVPILSALPIFSKAAGITTCSILCMPAARACTAPTAACRFLCMTTLIIR